MDQDEGYTKMYCTIYASTLNIEPLESILHEHRLRDKDDTGGMSTLMALALLNLLVPDLAYRTTLFV